MTHGKAPEHDDPMELTGVALPAPDASSVLEMTDCFAEEFLRMGAPPERVIAMFRSPFYAGPHLAWRTLGEAAVRERVAAMARAVVPGVRS